MKNTTHRVVILKNVNSDIISQAILILKNSDGFSESSVLAEAERVVEKYMNDNTTFSDKKKGKFMISFLGMSVLIFSLICIFTAMKIF
jgi:hypothetical protein